MADLVFAGLGAAVGSTIPGIGWQLGMSLGSAVGQMFFGGEMMPRQIVGRMSDLKVQGANQGVAIPLVFGKVRIAGNIIFASGLKESSKSSGGGKRPRVTNYSYSSTFAVLICLGPIAKIRKIYADSEVIYDDTGMSPVLHKSIVPDHLRIYLGTDVQTPDDALVAETGLSTPAYTGRAYVVFEDLGLTPFGSRIPNLNFEVDAGDATLQDVCERCAEESGLASDQYDFSALSGIVVDGYVVDGRTELKSILEDLSSVYLVDFAEIDGKIVGIPRGGNDSFTISWEDLGVGLGAPKLPRCQSVRAQEVDLPVEVTVAYSSAANGYQVMTQAAYRRGRTSQQQRSIQTMAVLSDDKARQTAYSRLFSEWAGRMRHTSSVGTKWLNLACGDVGLLELPNGNRRVRITEIVNEGVSVVGFRAVEDDPSIYTQDVLGGSPYSPEGTVAASSLPIWDVLDINEPWEDELRTTFVVLGASSGDAGWAGGSIDNSDLSNGFPRDIGSRFDSPCIMGKAVTVLPDGHPWIIDETSTVEVVLTRGALASITTDQMLFGSNMAILGSELIHFRTATLVSGNRWKLSGLMRGVRGSEWATNTHAIDETFLLLIDENGNRQTDGYVQFFSYYPSRAVSNFVLPHRLIESGTDYSGGLPTPKSTTLRGNSRKPWAPVQLDGVRGVGNDVDLTWVRRARRDNDLSDLTDVPLDEPTELYDLEIWNAAGNTLLRTVTGLTTPAYTYTSANQTTDLGAPGAFKFRVFQFTTWNGLGRGFASELHSVS